jgi:hypothetical protein
LVEISLVFCEQLTDRAFLPHFVLNKEKTLDEKLNGENNEEFGDGSERVADLEGREHERENGQAARMEDANVATEGIQVDAVAKIFYEKMKVWNKELRVIKARMDSEENEEVEENIAFSEDNATPNNNSNLSNTNCNSNDSSSIPETVLEDSKRLGELPGDDLVDLDDLYRLNGLRVSSDALSNEPSISATKVNEIQEIDGIDVKLDNESHAVEVKEIGNECDLGVGGPVDTSGASELAGPLRDNFDSKSIDKDLMNESSAFSLDESLVATNNESNEKSEVVRARNDSPSSKLREEWAVIALEKKRRNRNNSRTTKSLSTTTNDGNLDDSDAENQKIRADLIGKDIIEEEENEEDVSEDPDDFWKYGVHRSSMLYSLKSVNLGGCVGLTERSVISLIKRAPRLTTLCIPAVDISNLTLLHISRHCLRLQNLNLSLCMQVSGFGLRYCLKALRNLKHLDISGITLLTDMVLDDIAETSANLRHLDISYCLFSPRAIIQVVKSCRHLDTFRLKTSTENTMYDEMFEQLLKIRPKLNLIRNLM